MKKAVWLLVGLLLAAALVLASCSSDTTTDTTTDTPTDTPTDTTTDAPGMVRNVWGELVPEPQYGGTITYAADLDPREWDPYYGGGANWPIDLVLEKLGLADWGIHRDEFNFQSAFIPLYVSKPHLAESYDQPDPLHIVFHIRQGVYWHDKAPMNGREFDAYDVEFSFHRMLGLGSGFTEPSPLASSFAALPIESVTATDKWTVVVALSGTSFEALPSMYYDDYFGSWIVPREVIEQYEAIKDWRHLVGTGPYELTDYVSGASMTHTRNPNYWLTDERYPGYQLPFADEIKALIIPDYATQLAALRSGKIDTLGVPMDQAESLRGTNPELSMVTITGAGGANSATMLVNQPPFDDILVRQAMQKAINLEEIGDLLFGGFAATTPAGVISPALEGYHIPFDEWPEEVKEGYRYDPEAARQLLVDAGLPDGFKTKWDVSTDWGMNIDVAQILKTYWAEIGVDVELNMLESGSMWDRYQNRTYEGMTYGEGRYVSYNPVQMLRYAGYSEEQWNPSGSNDPVFDDLLDKANAAADLEEMLRYVREADMRYSEMQWTLFLPVPDSFEFYQPWLKGYNAESTMGGGSIILPFSRAWVDQDLK